jgi:formylglycine-generating enzyme required for sulfatase activity
VFRGGAASDELEAAAADDADRMSRILSAGSSPSDTDMATRSTIVIANPGILMRSVTTLAIAAISPFFGTASLHAQSSFGSGCAGASGVTPTMSVSGIVKSGSTWTLEVTAPGGIGLGYLAIGFSGTTASAIGGLPLPLDLGVLFGDPLWSGCALNVDPSYALQPYAFDPNVNGGLATFTFPGFDIGTVYMQAINIDADFVTRIAGVSQGLAVRRTAPAGMVAIEPGTFQMGSNATFEWPYYQDFFTSSTIHTVTITYPFWMGQHEVTQADYAALMGSNPSVYVGPNHPVENLTWIDARAYCTALNVAETLAGNVPLGYEYRLPTEAEWEYACRARTTTEFNTGPELVCAEARMTLTYHGGPPMTFCGYPNGPGDVGSFAPNAWGLYDMHGNVWEYCLDTYHLFTSAPVTDPFVTGPGVRIIRGGAWHSASSDCRSGNRYFVLTDSARDFYGFRVVLGPVLIP